MAIVAHILVDFVLMFLNLGRRIQTFHFLVQIGNQALNFRHIWVVHKICCFGFFALLKEPFIAIDDARLTCCARIEVWVVFSNVASICEFFGLILQVVIFLSCEII